MTTQTWKSAVRIGRSPRGERGLKSTILPYRKQILCASLPPRGAWIEMFLHIAGRSGGGWSLPPRGAWIEIGIWDSIWGIVKVAPPAGSVD